MIKIYPPIGYKMEGKGYIDGNNEEELREYALNMSDNPKFKTEISQASKKELIEFFETNGFEIEK